MIWFGRGKGRGKDAAQNGKLEESQKALLSAATAAANVARDVTSLLKSRLDDADRRIDATTRIINDALFLCTMEGEIRAFNPAAEDLFGKLRIGGALTDAFAALGISCEDIDTLWRLLASPALGPCPANVLRGVRNSQPVFLEPKVERLEWSDGSCSMLVLVRDAGCATACNGQPVIDTRFDGVLIIQKDRIVAANPSAARLFGYSPENIVRVPVSALFSSEDQAILVDHDGSSPFGVRGTDQRGKTLNLLFTTSRITWQQDHALLVTIKDMADTKDFTMRRDNGVDMILRFDASFRIISANKCYADYVGEDRADLINGDARAFIECDAPDVFYAALTGLTPERPSLRSVTRRTVEGTLMIHDWVDHAVFDNKGSPIEYQRTGRDITHYVSTGSAD